MGEQGGRPVDDEVLTDTFDRLVPRSGAPVPPMSDLEGRVAVRARRRRTRRRAALGACAALVVLAGIAAVMVGSSSDGDDGQDLSSKPTPTTAPAVPAGEPVFTIERAPEHLAFRACGPMATGDDPADITGVVCTFDEPATAGADGLRITRVVGGATAELQAAWEAGDAPAAAEASGGSDDPAVARFTTLSGTEVLDLTIDGRPSSDESAAVRVLVGDDLVDLGATGVPLAELGQVVTGLVMAPPSPLVEQALAALPEGSTALVTGERPLWSQPDAIRPEERAPFSGETVGTEFAVPGSDTLLGVDVTTGIDVDALLDELVASGDPDLTATEIGGRRAVVLAPAGMMPVAVPEPRTGPQVLVRLDASTLLRVKHPDGDPAQIRTVADAIR